MATAMTLFWSRTCNDRLKLTGRFVFERIIALVNATTVPSPVADRFRYFGAICELSSPQLVQQAAATDGDLGKDTWKFFKLCLVITKSKSLVLIDNVPKIEAR